MPHPYIGGIGQEHRESTQSRFNADFELAIADRKSFHSSPAHLILTEARWRFPIGG